MHIKPFLVFARTDVIQFVRLVILVPVRIVMRNLIELLSQKMQRATGLSKRGIRLFI